MKPCFLLPCFIEIVFLNFYLKKYLTHTMPCLAPKNVPILPGLFIWPPHRPICSVFPLSALWKTEQYTAVNPVLFSPLFNMVGIWSNKKSKERTIRRSPGIPVLSVLISSIAWGMSERNLSLTQCTICPNICRSHYFSTSQWEQEKNQDRLLIT